MKFSEAAGSRFETTRSQEWRPGRYDSAVDTGATPQRYYYHFDGIGSVAAISNAAGEIIETYKYDVYGDTVIRDTVHVSHDTSIVGNPYGFTGRRLDPETGLYYYRARYYDAKMGRFLSVDPLGIDDENAYAYCGNDPVNWIDPLGLMTVPGGFDYKPYVNVDITDFRPKPYDTQVDLDNLPAPEPETYPDQGGDNPTGRKPKEGPVPGENGQGTDKGSDCGPLEGGIPNANLNDNTTDGAKDSGTSEGDSDDGDGDEKDKGEKENSGTEDQNPPSGEEKPPDQDKTKQKTQYPKQDASENLENIEKAQQKLRQRGQGERIRNINKSKQKFKNWLKGF